ncbi:uncharacterized protein [Venturia canescens]|uniref:uncharacterized protein n=1 Tax=Venturia canescens TaxID=32260 RepID=UPI001C9C2792|nr:uncharacterized protein LOC122415295 [Venturia canescens]
MYLFSDQNITMDTNYRNNISKWLSSQDSGPVKRSVAGLRLIDSMNRYANNVISTLQNMESFTFYDEQILGPWIDELGQLLQSYRKIIRLPEPLHRIVKYKFNYSSLVLKSGFKVTAKFLDTLLQEVVIRRTDAFLQKIFRLIIQYNSLFDLNNCDADLSINLCFNDCPPMLTILKKVSITHLLQVSAKNDAEKYCHDLIDCLLANYDIDYEEKVASPESADVEISENSSVEIYRALTKHMILPVMKDSVAEIITSNSETIETLVNMQYGYVNVVLNVAKDFASQLLGYDCLKRTEGGVKLKTKARNKIFVYYQEVTWGAVSTVLDHVILWWSPEALAPRHIEGVHHLKDWLHQFIQDINVRNDCSNILFFSLQPSLNSSLCLVNI